MHLVPRNDHPDHAARLLTVICDESPDLVIPARDHDVDSLAALVAIHRALASKTAVGAFPCAEIMRDKYLSWQFASRHHLAFAETLPTGRDLAAIALANFIDRHAYPLFAKPRCGYGSIGVRVILNRTQLDCAGALPD